jgi:hypothetical protein
MWEKNSIFVRLVNKMVENLPHYSTRIRADVRKLPCMVLDEYGWRQKERHVLFLETNRDYSCKED